MKVGNFFAVVLLLSAALCIMTGCQKSDIDNVTGSYTYKTSGVVGLLPTAYIGRGVELDTTWAALSTEQGQMNIVTKDSGTKLMIVSWNDLTGNACSTEATVEGNILTLKDGIKAVTLTDGSISVMGTSPLGSGIIRYSGEGALYDDMLIMPLDYKGVMDVSGTSMTIVASKIECIAKAN